MGLVKTNPGGYDRGVEGVLYSREDSRDVYLLFYDELKTALKHGACSHQD